VIPRVEDARAESEKIAREIDTIVEENRVAELKRQLECWNLIIPYAITTGIKSGYIGTEISVPHTPCPPEIIQNLENLGYMVDYLMSRSQVEHDILKVYWRKVDLASPRPEQAQVGFMTWETYRQETCPSY
jgi:hypothetical protein